MSSHAIGPFALIAFSLAGVALVVWGATIGKAEFIVEDYDATTLVPPDTVGHLDRWGNIAIDIGQS